MALNAGSDSQSQGATWVYRMGACSGTGDTLVLNSAQRFAILSDRIL